MDVSLPIRTDRFDGPLGLLLFLLQKQDMNIRDLDLTQITKQYLDYLGQMRELNFDIAGDYLYLAVTLLLLKSKEITRDDSRTLENEEESHLNITSHSDLVRRLEQLQLYQKLGRTLWKRSRLGHDVFVRPKVKKKVAVDSILAPVDLEKLTAVMSDFLYKQKRRYTIIKTDTISIKEKLAFLKGCLRKNSNIDFDSLLELHGGKELGNIVVTFISLLELARLKWIHIFQNEGQSVLYIKILKSLDTFDLNSARGFMEEEKLQPAMV